MNQINKIINCDVMILGAGGAGLMCAIEASKRHNHVIVLEHNAKIGEKIRISGGGRCNFTNKYTSPTNYLSNNPHFCKSALANYTPHHFCNLLNKHKIQYHEKKLGQLFCDKSAQNIIDLLRKLCEENGVKIILNTKIKKITKKDAFTITTNHSTFQSPKLVVATGGLSIPALGATDLGYKIAKQFNLNIIEPHAALVPLTLSQNDLNKLSNLSGVSISSHVSIKKHLFPENLLFTHKGLSGPAILQISSYWRKDTPITINLLPDENINDLLFKNRKRKTTLKNFLNDYLPQRLTDKICSNYLSNRPLNQYTDKEINKISNHLTQWQITPQDTEGYKKAEVTAGGVDTDELSSKTMESKKIKGLYFIGEVVDVTGHLGGFNFQWAWASAFAAGNAL